MAISLALSSGLFCSASSAPINRTPGGNGRLAP